MARRLGFTLLWVVVLITGTLMSPASVTDAAPSLPQAWEAPHVAGELLVKLPAGGRMSLSSVGTDVISEIPALGLAVVKTQPGRSLAQAAEDLQIAAGVEWAEPNYTFDLDFVPNDPNFNLYQTGVLDRIGARAAWDLSQGRSEIVIAVLDTGVDMSHEDLAGGIWTNPGEIPNNGIDDEGNGFIDDVNGWDFADGTNNPDDDHSHGTHVAGIAAARINNGKGTAGLAGRATIMPVDVFSGAIGTYEDLIRAIIYATDNGADVINMSLGSSSYSRGEEMAVNYAFSRGVVLVAAAGNTGKAGVHYPAAHDNVIAVASTTADDALSSFSTQGAWVDVTAPGSGVFSTLRGSKYGSMSGTSMATPHVAGLAGLILSRNSSLTPSQVQAIIESTAQDLGPAGRDSSFGAGRINAGRALAATSPGPAPSQPGQPGSGLDIDLDGCIGKVVNGGFEAGLSSWWAQGAVVPDRSVFHTGGWSLRFQGGPLAGGTVAQAISIPPGTRAAVLKFAYRIYPNDGGTGTPLWPFDDWFIAEWRAGDGRVLGQLLGTGNTADTVRSGLEWDTYLYRLTEADVAALAAEKSVALVFIAQNDWDPLATDVWLDSVQLCLAGPMAQKSYLPSVRRGR